MGIQIEFHPELALFSKMQFTEKANEKCIPSKLEVGKIYNFLRSGQGIYWMENEIPLVEIRKNGVISRPIASIKIIEESHFTENDQIHTKGKFKVIEVINVYDNKIHFEGMNKI